MRALASVIDAERIAAIVNTGDDEWFHGLYVSPDPDIVTYALAGEVDEEHGWGLRGDTFRWLESLERFGHDTWFRIGDRDLATHLHRTRLLRAGWPLSRVASEIAAVFGIRVRILPMSDDRVRTVVATDDGELPFQEYLVKRGARDAVQGVWFEGAAVAMPSPGVIEALREAEAIFIAPSNPIGSIGPILAVRGVREAIEQARVRRVAVSPIIAGRSLQPPAGEMMAGLGHSVDVSGLATIYAGLIDALVIDEADARYADDVSAKGIEPIVARTLMDSGEGSSELARAALDAAHVSSA